MDTVLLSIKTDADTKEQLRAFAAELGVSSTALVNLVIKQAIRDRRVVLDTNLEPTSYLEGVMRQAEDDLAKGDVQTFTTKEAAVAHLRSL